jgi:hypothetical protein
MNYAVGPDFEKIVERFAQTTDAVIESVSRLIPQEFPARVSHPVFEGMRRHAAILKAG